MAYDQSPQDEGYSEDPLTIGTVSGSANVQNWIQSLPVSQRTGKVSGIAKSQYVADIPDSQNTL